MIAAGKVKPVNKAAMQKKGWLWKVKPGEKNAQKKKVTGMKCRWCAEKDDEDWPEGGSHTFAKCPDKAAAEVEYAIREADYMEHHKRTQLMYTLPSLTYHGTLIPVCKATFANVIGLSDKSEKLVSLHKRDQTTPQITRPVVGRSAGYNDVQQAKFGQHLRRYPRSTGHYSVKTQDKDRFFKNEALTRVHIWKDWCYLQDHEFWVQATRCNFWKGYDTYVYKPQPSEALVSPLLSYSSACEYLKVYDVRFKHLAIDTCDTCDRFRVLISDPATSADKVIHYEDQKFVHLTKANECYAKRTLHVTDTHAEYPRWTLPEGEGDDAATCCENVPFRSKDKTDTQIQDAFGNLRTPRMTNGEAYYLRILPVWVYDFYSAATETHYLYSWNEEIGHKGPNNIISAEYHHHCHHRTGAVRLNKWMDGCYAQANNKTMMKYNVHITDPHSEMYFFERLDEYVCLSGHSYLICDAACGNVQAKSRERATIGDKEEWEEIMRTANSAHPNCVTKFDQELHLDFAKYLAQYYVGMRDGHDEAKMRISKARWRNYGVGELWDEELGDYLVLAHPGEVWVRYSNNRKEMPQRLDLRRNCGKKARYQMPVTPTASLPVLGVGSQQTPKLITDPVFVLYKDGLLPISVEKMKDLRTHSKLLPKHQQAQYRYHKAGPDDETDDEDAGTEDEHEPEEPDDDDDGEPEEDENEGGSSRGSRRSTRRHR